MERIRQWGKKVVIIVNKIDILESAEDLARIERFIGDNAMALLGFTPQIFPLSSKTALQAKQRGAGPELTRSRFEEMERYVVHALDERERFRLRLAEVDNLLHQFENRGARLLDSVGRAAQRTLEDYDREGEASRMAESVQAAVAGAALLEVGAVGLGTAVSLLASTTAADVTGLLAAVGLFVIPQRRRSARKELREKIAALRRQLMNSLTAQFDREIDRSLLRLGEAIAPYTRFVRGERDALNTRRQELTRIREEMLRLKAQAEA